MINKAYEIAVRDLKSCYRNHGIVAGNNYFNDYWARDAFFASFGALELKDFEVVRNGLEMFLQHMKKGMIPYRFLSKNHALNYFGIMLRYKNPVPNYRILISSYHLDQNSLFIILFYGYIKKTEDYRFLKKHYLKLKKILDWNFSNDCDKDFILEEGIFSNWMDHILKSGKVLYTNVLHCHAIKCFYKLSELKNEKEDVLKFKEVYKKTKEKINMVFWNGDYYIDWIDSKKRNYFDSVGNLLAIIYDIADRKKTKRIHKFIKEKKLESFTLKSNYPKHPFWRVVPHLQLTGISDYANYRLWIGCLDVLAKVKSGKKEEALTLFKKISEKINEYEMVYEVYDKKGKPLYNLFYKSERPFAWSAGLFIYAAKVLKDENCIFD